MIRAPWNGFIPLSKTITSLGMGEFRNNHDSLEELIKSSCVQVFTNNNSRACFTEFSEKEMLV